MICENTQQYQKLASRTEPNNMAAPWARLHPLDQCHSPVNMRLLHAAFGIQTEGGEFTDQLKRHVFYGKELDKVNLTEELGDVLWYVALACNALGIDMQDVMGRNIAKLQARFPEKFTEENALERDLDSERGILEGREE